MSDQDTDCANGQPGRATGWNIDGANIVRRNTGEECSDGRVVRINHEDKAYAEFFAGIVTRGPELAELWRHKRPRVSDWGNGCRADGRRPQLRVV